MADLAVVCWRNKATGETGKGINPTPRRRGEMLVANLNKNFAGFEHWLEPAPETKPLEGANGGHPVKGKAGQNAESEVRREVRREGAEEADAIPRDPR